MEMKLYHFKKFNSNPWNNPFSNNSFPFNKPWIILRKNCSVFYLYVVSIQIKKFM